MSTKRTDPIGAQPTDPPWARLLFLLVQGRDGQWWRGFLLVALTGLLLVGVLAVLPVFAGWIGGALGVGSLTAWAVARRRGGATRL
ncbi:MAG: hypothetical protein ACRDSZ_20810 [Pseudonocardiaceae bacterium]